MIEDVGGFIGVCPHGQLDTRAQQDLARPFLIWILLNAGEEEPAAARAQGVREQLLAAARGEELAAFDAGVARAGAYVEAVFRAAREVVAVPAGGVAGKETGDRRLNFLKEKAACQQTTH